MVITAKYFVHFTDEETKVQISHTAQVARPGNHLPLQRLLIVPVRWLEITNLSLRSGNYIVRRPAFGINVSEFTHDVVK